MHIFKIQDNQAPLENKPLMKVQIRFISTLILPGSIPLRLYLSLCIKYTSKP